MADAAQTLAPPSLGEQQAPRIPMVQFQCANDNCKQTVMARQPVPQLFNFPSVSGIVLPHERVSRCPHCGAAYVPMIGGLGPEGQLQIAWMPIQAQQASQSSIVKPGYKDVEMATKSKLIQP